MNIGLGENRKTILLIDKDPHARAALRLALEAAGFSVGEAADDKEGERTALRIKPGAVVAELMLDTGTEGMSIAERLHEAQNGVPCYILSSAGDALMGSVGLHEIGISGVFLKPADAAIVIQTLETRLGMPGILHD
jgi:two-component system OmpR family response regulator